RPGPATPERPARADASHAEDGGNEAGRVECAAAAGAFRCLRRALQPGAPPSGTGHAGAGGRLHALPARLSWPRGAHLSVPRRHRPDLNRRPFDYESASAMRGPSFFCAFVLKWTPLVTTGEYGTAE